MPAKKQFESNKEILLIALVVIVAVIALAWVFPFTPSDESKLDENKPGLSCSMQGADAIKCTWSNCQLMPPPDKSEVIIGKEPNYVDSVAVTSTEGSTILYPPSPTSGDYVLFVSCQNGVKSQRVII